MSNAAEIKVRTSHEVKEEAANLFDHWGLSLNDGINIFLRKCIDVKGIPFSIMLPEPLITKDDPRVYHPQVDENGALILPTEWEDGDIDDDYAKFATR